MLQRYQPLLFSVASLLTHFRIALSHHVQPFFSTGETRRFRRAVLGRHGVPWNYSSWAGWRSAAPEVAKKRFSNLCISPRRFGPWATWTHSTWQSVEWLQWSSKCAAGTSTAWFFAGRAHMMMKSSSAVSTQKKEPPSSGYFMVELEPAVLHKPQAGECSLRQVR